MPTLEQRALQPLLDDWTSRRDDARVLLIRELDSDRYKRWVDDYRDFVRTEGAAVLPVLPTQPHRVRDTAASRIWAAYEQVRAYEPVLRWADVETLHELRIAGKWLRYTLEFVRDALGDDAGPLIARVTALQDHLGLMNDADVAASLARTFLVEHAGSCRRSRAPRSAVTWSAASARSPGFGGPSGRPGEASPGSPSGAGSGGSSQDSSGAVPQARIGAPSRLIRSASRGRAREAVAPFAARRARRRGPFPRGLPPPRR